MVCPCQVKSIASPFWCSDLPGRAVETRHTDAGESYTSGQPFGASQARLEFRRTPARAAKHDAIVARRIEQRVERRPDLGGDRDPLDGHKSASWRRSSLSSSAASDRQPHAKRELPVRDRDSLLGALFFLLRVDQQVARLVSCWARRCPVRIRRCQR